MDKRSGTARKYRWPLRDRLLDSYVHARNDCGYGVVAAVYRAVWFEVTGRWPT